MTAACEVGPKNHWISDADTTFAEWRVQFDVATGFADLELLLLLVGRIIELGERERVYTLHETGHPMNFCRADGSNYVDFLLRTLKASHVLPLFDFGVGAAPTAAGQLRTPGELCYFDAAGNVIQADVDNMGLLLRQLRPKDVEWGSSFMQDVSPVILLSQPARVHKGKIDRPVEITIMLCTDIWFPRVLGMLEGDQPIGTGTPKWYDNRKLAFCHTPRLNKFLGGVRESSQALGGTWSLSEAKGMARHYSTMVHESGLVLA